MEIVNHFVLSAFADEIASDLNTQMDVLEQHGINYIEIRGVNGKPVVGHTLEEVANIKKELDKRGFKISSIGSPIGKIYITDSFEPHLELFRHTVRIAEILNAKYIRMFSFYIPKGEYPLAYRDEVLRRWGEFIKVAENTGLTLLHENEKDIYGETPERCLDLLKTLNCSYVKAVFDPANFIQCDIETYPHAFHLLKDYIAYMHIKDAFYKDHTVAPAGCGDGKIELILKDLKSLGFEGFLSLEPHLAVFSEVSANEQASEILYIYESRTKAFSASAEALIKILKHIAET